MARPPDHRWVRAHAATFAGLIKWSALATAVGVMVGMSTTGFLRLLAWSGHAVQGTWWLRFALPPAFIASAWLVRTFAPDAGGHGTERVIAALHRTSGRIDASVVPVKLVATVVTLAAGGSAGKEGPCAQIGAGLCSTLARLLRLSAPDRRKLVICGVSAGFATVFGTPIAGALFGIEVLSVGTMLYDVMLPSFVAGIIGFQASVALGIRYPVYGGIVLPQFSELFFIKIIGAGIWAGSWALLLILALRAAHGLPERARRHPYLVAAAAGVGVALLGWAGDGRPLGLGLPVINGAISGGAVHWFDPAAKVLCTVLTLGGGGSGGIVTPLFYVGATAGSLYARALALDPGTFAAIGLVATLAGATNTPIAASIMAVELFGAALAPYAAMACIVSFLVTGYRSVYPSQRIGAAKSSELLVETGGEIQHARPAARIPSLAWFGGRPRRTVRPGSGSPQM